MKTTLYTFVFSKRLLLLFVLALIGSVGATVVHAALEGGGGGGGLGPTATISASPTSVTAGGAVTVTWSSVRTVSCDKNFGSGTAVSGSVVVNPAVTTGYEITCYHSDGREAFASVTVTVTGAPSATASLSVSPASIPAGSSSLLTWSSTNAASCVGTNFNTGNAANNAVGVYVTPTVTTTYSITCGTASNSKTVTVSSFVCPVGYNCTCPANTTCSAPVWICDDEPFSNPSYTDFTTTCEAGGGSVHDYGPGVVSGCFIGEARYYTSCWTPPPPAGATASLSASPASVVIGSASTLTWSSTNADYCSSVQFDTQGATSGSKSVVPGATGANNYTVTCTGTTQSGSGTWQYERSDVTDMSCPWTDLNRPYPLMPHCDDVDDTVPPSGPCTTPPAHCKFNSGICSYATTDIYACITSTVPSNASANATITANSPAPTASLTASPPSIVSGESTTLTWSSTNATSCTGTNFTATGSATSGSVNVSPVVNTTYTITCTGPGGSANNAKTVTIDTVAWVNFGCGVITNSYNGSCNPTQEWLDITCNAGQMLQGRSVSGFQCSAPNNPFKDQRRCIADVSCPVPTPNLTAGASTFTAQAGSPFIWVGPTFTFNSTISNNGTGSATNFPNLFQLSDATHTPTLALLASQNLTLGAGVLNTAITGTRTFATPGTYSVRSCADSLTGAGAGGNQTESNEGDNCGAWLDFSVAPATPTGLAASCNASGTQATFSWTAVPNSSFYYVRATKPTGSACPSGWQNASWAPTTTCTPNPDSVAGTSIVYPTTPGFASTVYVHSAIANGTWSPAASANFTCNTTNLSGSCWVSPTTAATGENVLWTAVASGGTASSGGHWQNDGVVSSNTKICSGVNIQQPACSEISGWPGGSCTVGSICKTHTYDAAAPFDCESQPPAGSATIYGSVTRYSCVSSSGGSAYTYSWTGTDGLSGTAPSVSKSYATVGNKYAAVNITSGSQNINVLCDGDAIPGDGVITVSPPTPQCDPSTGNEDGDAYTNDAGGDPSCTGPTDPTETPVSPFIVSFTCGSPATSTCLVTNGQNTRLDWSASPAGTTCANAGGEGAAGFSTGGAISGSDTTVGPIIGNATYQLNCTLNGETVSKQVAINVLTPHSYIEANPDHVSPVGAPSTISWSAEQVLSCSVTESDDAGNSTTLWGPVSPVSPAVNIATPTPAVRSIKKPLTYTITCDGGATTARARANPPAGFTEF